MDAKKRVLIVDDRKGMRTALSYGLQARYEVRSAGSVREAVEAFASVRPNVVLLDVLLGAEDGLALISEFKSIAPSVPVMALTVVTNTMTVQRAISAGCVDYIEKPFSLDHLCDRIEACTATAHGGRDVNATAQSGEQPQ